MSKDQQITQWTAKITKIVASYQRLSGACDKAIEAGALDINGPFHAAIWRAWDGMLGMLDHDEWISWYLCENECGERGFEAAAPGCKSRRIRTPRQLARIIVESL